jgi:hypothetical protein
MKLIFFLLVTLMEFALGPLKSQSSHYFHAGNLVVLTAEQTNQHLHNVLQGRHWANHLEPLLQSTRNQPNSPLICIHNF